LSENGFPKWSRLPCSELSGNESDRRRLLFVCSFLLTFPRLCDALNRNNRKWPVHPYFPIGLMSSPEVFCPEGHLVYIYWKSPLTPSLVFYIAALLDYFCPPARKGKRAMDGGMSVRRPTIAQDTTSPHTSAPSWDKSRKISTLSPISLSMYYSRPPCSIGSNLRLFVEWVSFFVPHSY